MNTISTNILPTTYNNDNNSNQKEDNNDNNNNSNIDNNNDNKLTNYPHLQEHLTYISSDARLNDGITNMKVGSVVATVLNKKGKIPWFGKVVKMNDNNSVCVLWLY